MNVICRQKDRTVSVIIPTFNRAKYIREAIDSVLAQIPSAFEVIVVDDGSTDNTKEIVMEYGNAVKYLFQKNGGPSSARNRGIRIAKGNFIAFLDSDDLWVPDKLKMQMEFFGKYPDVDLVFGHQVLFSGMEYSNIPEILNGEVYRYFRKNFQNPERAFDYLLLENIIPPSSVMFKSQCLNKVGFFDERLGCSEDFDYWLRFVRFFRLGFMDTVLVRRRMHDDNIIHDYQFRFQSHLTVLKSLSSKFPELSRSKKRRIWRCLCATYYRLGSYYFEKRDYDNAFRNLKEAFPLYFFKWKYCLKIIWSLIFRKRPF